MKQLELIDLGTTYSVIYATEDKYEDKEFTDTLLLDLYLKGKGVSKETLQEMSDNLYTLDMEEKDGVILKTKEITKHEGKDGVYETQGTCSDGVDGVVFDDISHGAHSGTGGLHGLQSDGYGL